MSSTLPSLLIYAGTFERVMDGKHRVTIPAAWLAQGVNEFHAIPNPSEECLIVMPAQEFQAVEEKIHQSSAAPAERRKAIRQFYSRARAVNADAHGRILFSDEQCAALHLQGEVVLVGGVVVVLKFGMRSAGMSLQARSTIPSVILLILLACNFSNA